MLIRFSKRTSNRNQFIKTLRNVKIINIINKRIKRIYEYKNSWKS